MADPKPPVMVLLDVLTIDDDTYADVVHTIASGRRHPASAIAVARPAQTHGCDDVTPHGQGDPDA